MIVSELIEQLSKLPGELDVMAEDSENGPYDVTRAEVREAWGIYPRHVVIT